MQNTQPDRSFSASGEVSLRFKYWWSNTLSCSWKHLVTQPVSGFTLQYAQSVFQEVAKLCLFYDFFLSTTTCVFGIQVHGYIKILLMSIQLKLELTEISEM